MNIFDLQLCSNQKTRGLISSIEVTGFSLYVSVCLLECMCVIVCVCVCVCVCMYVYVCVPACTGFYAN